MAVKKTNNTKFRKSITPRYALSELTAHAKELFDVPAEVLAGAMYRTDGERFTVAEVKQKIEQFMKAKVV
ncbi:hypothetical protein [Paenibacillus faecalis]|uniref:hypothetical protein n=1 Tax=Paenibacillus faecalis TaxID=2079532 RepID=UPI000D10A0E7|nr:hypothetical protein [Paenibacillus faecalis]